MPFPLNLAVLPSSAHNHPNSEVVYKNGSFIISNVSSTNDEGRIRTKLVMERTSHGSVPVDVVLILARFEIAEQKGSYIVLTRQWREATDAYSIALPAGKYDRTDHDVVAAGLRELTEETPFTADRENVFLRSVLSYSSDGCLRETNQMLGVYARIKSGTRLRDGLAQGATEQTENENIQTLYCAERELYPTLLEWEQQGHSIDSRLMFFAIGVHLAASLPDAANCISR
jgi:hypothetical protein